MVRLLVIVLVLGIAGAAAAAQTSRSAPGRIQTTTRLVAMFTNLENELSQAVAEKNEAKLSRLLAPDFEEWTPAPPGSPIPRAEWLQGASSQAGSRLRQMAAKDLGQHVAVHFVAVNGSAASFIVDIWQKNGSDWQLIERYRSPVEAAAHPSDLPPTGKQ